MIIFLLETIAVVCLFYNYIVRPLSYWKNLGVEQGNPKWLFGHFLDNIIGKKNGTEVVHKVYQQSPDARYTGMYRFSSPVFLLRDPELIKQITIKDFESFMDHSSVIPPETDLLWAKNLFNLNGSEWREMRTHLSPSFTSSKMRTLFVLMTDCAENFVQHLLGKNQDVVTAEMKDIFSRYTNDVIASTAFGLKVDSLSQPNNEFYRMSHEVADLSTFWKTFKMLACWFIPLLKYLIKVQFISDESAAYFRGIMDETIKTREEKGIIRPDMLHLLLQARKNAQMQRNNDLVNENNSNPTSYLSNEDITANALIFIITGFGSVSSFISFSVYELAVNPDVQEKLRKEVLETLQKCGGKVTYEALLDMTYMDMIVSETLRKWPHFIVLDRICTKPYTVEPVSSSERAVQIKKGTMVMIPIYSIHHDPKYFPDPERFNPERFNDENKGNIEPCTYFPFGLGPRTCIASRFALLEGKIVLFHLLSHFEVVPVGKTDIPLKFSKNTFINLEPVGGFWLGFKRCKN